MRYFREACGGIASELLRDVTKPQIANRKLGRFSKQKTWCRLWDSNPRPLRTTNLKMGHGAPDPNQSVCARREHFTSLLRFLIGGSVSVSEGLCTPVGGETLWAR